MDLNQKNKYENNLRFQNITFSIDNVLKFKKIRHNFFCKYFTKTPTMLLLSSKEESRWLPEKLPGVEELIFHLTKMNDNVMVYVKRIYRDDKNDDKIYEMSNGISYKKGIDGRWSVV